MPLPLNHIVKESRVNKSGQQVPVKGLHWLAVAASLLVTLAAWQLSKNNAEERRQTKFDLHADYSIELFKLQMDRYATMLDSGVGFIIGSENVEPEEWRDFIQRIELEEKFPAIGGIGVVYRIERDQLTEFVETQRRIRPNFTIRPAVDLESIKSLQYVMPLTLIAPKRLEASVAGLDIARESRRRDAIERSIRTGTVQITAPISPDSIEGPGFVMVAPIFNTMRPETSARRQEEFIGAVVAPIITTQLANGILDSGIRQVAIQVSDDADIMYSELVPENKDLDSAPLIKSSRTVSLYGRDWHFDIQSTKAFRKEHSGSTSTLILVFGLLVDALLLILFLHMSKVNQRATKFGKVISEKYERQSADLLQTNDILENRNNQLESFSYVVSHDLRTPLRGIGFLADCIEEDINEHQPIPTLPPTVLNYITRIKKQVTLAQDLITGILRYSGLGTDEEIIEKVDVHALLLSLRSMLAVKETQLQLIGEFPTFDTYQTQLTQVFMNLISNGYKYHGGNGQAVITVGIEASPLADFYRFTVSDNGPGIKAAYHEKIFEPFSTLQPKDHSMSSGVGLAIVKTLVNQHGGTITIASELGQGSCFSFDWPCSIQNANTTLELDDFSKAA